MSGQTVGHAIHLDFSKYMNEVLEFNAEERWVRLQPGLVSGCAQCLSASQRLSVGPRYGQQQPGNTRWDDGNNSAGARSVLLWQDAIDHVLEMTVVLSDGEEARFNPAQPQELAASNEGRPAGEPPVSRGTGTRTAQHREEIERRYPKLMRRVGGYNLDEFTKDQPFNLGRMVIGSEGTLAVVTEAKVKVMPRPKLTALDVVHFRSLVDAVESSQEILSFRPAAMETDGQDDSRLGPAVAGVFAPHGLRAG